MFLAVRQTWSQDRVFFVDTDARQFSLPVGWTDAAEPDPFVVVAAGRCPFRLGDLVELQGLIGGLAGGNDCKADYAVNVRLITPLLLELAVVESRHSVLVQDYCLAFTGVLLRPE